MNVIDQVDPFIKKYFLVTLTLSKCKVNRSKKTELKEWSLYVNTFTVLLKF